MKAYVCRIGEDKVTQSGKSCASSALPQLCAYMATFAGLWIFNIFLVWKFITISFFVKFVLVRSTTKPPLPPPPFFFL